MKPLQLLLQVITKVARINFFCTKTKVEFNGSYLKQNKVTYNHGKVVTSYILHEIS